MLNGLTRDKGLVDGFEGNAQSFRIVSSLTVGDPADSKGNVILGLNLTRRTLDGILKYPWFFGENEAKKKKWGAYETERKLFQWVRSDFQFGKHIKCLEAEVMDWADDITYAVHDVIDFYCAGKIPLEQLRSSDDIGEAERKAFFDEVFSREDITEPGEQERLRNAFFGIIELFPLDRRYKGTVEERWKVWQFITMLISRYVDAFDVKDGPTREEPLVKIEPNAVDEIRILKQLTWHYVIHDNELATPQRGQVYAVGTVFNTLSEVVRDRKLLKLFSPRFEKLIRDTSDENLILRYVCDYVSGMTEKEVLTVHNKLNGTSK